MLRKKILLLLIPTITFVIGILVQSLFDQWLTLKSVMPLSIAVIFIALVAIFGVLLRSDTRFDEIDNQLVEITNRTGIHAEYIEDGPEGKSYMRGMEMVEKARTSLTFVGYWEPFAEYHANNTSVMSGESKILDARRRFYQAVVKQVELHQNDEAPFHRRIVQTPKEYATKRLPLETDPVFFEYMVSIAQIQELKPYSCSLRKSTTFINFQFTVIDNRYIIIPILTHVNNLLQARHGALIIEDSNGELVERLKAIYWILENRSQPFKLNELKL